MTSRLVVDGYYGMLNAGDDAFCVVAAEMANRCWNVKHLAFVAPDSRLPMLPVPARGVFPEHPRFRGHGRLRPLAAMLRAGHVVHVGGSTFHSMTGRHRDQARLSFLGLLTLDAVGVSVGPFPSPTEGRRMVAHLRRFRQIHVRDEASAERLRAIDPTLTPTLGFDVAVLLPTLDFCRIAIDSARSERAPGPPILGISVCNDASLRGAYSAAEERRERNVIELLRELAVRQSVRYRFIVFNAHPRWGDHDITRRVAETVADRADIEIVAYTGDVRTTLSAVAGCDALLGTRLHSGVFAYACAVPFALIAYHRKSGDFAREVRLPSRFLFPVQGPELGAAAAMEALLEVNRDTVAGMLSVETARRRALKGFTDISW